MEFGVSFYLIVGPGTMKPSAYFASAFELATIADREGMASVKMTEHYLNPYGGYCPSPLSFLAAVAARTRRVRLITGCILPAFHHPIQIAAETADGGRD